jgi:hypothetical protein
MRAAILRTTLAAVGLTAVCGSAQAAPFAIRFSGTGTALVLDEGSAAPYGAFRSAWIYQFFRRGGGLTSERLQILATRQVVNCRTRQTRDLASVRYLASGVRIAATGSDAAWTTSLRGSNSDRLLTAICEGPDAAWSRAPGPTVFDVYRSTWRR